MPQLGELLQMISTLSGIQNDKQRLSLAERQLQQGASQFAQMGQEREFGQAIQLMAQGNQKSREALDKALTHLAPHYRAQVEAMMNNPVDAGVQRADAMQSGVAALTPQQRGTFDQEAASTGLTGMNTGGVQSSQLLSQLAGGAQSQITPDQIQAFAERTATGRSPIEAMVQGQQVTQGLVPAMARIGAGTQMSAAQAAQNTVGMGNLAQGWAQLDLGERRMAMEYGINLAKMDKRLTDPKDRLQAVDAMSKLINDINNPRSDAKGNLGRIKLFNLLAGQVDPELAFPADQAPANPGAVTRYWQSLPGNAPQVPYGTRGMAPPAGPNTIPQNLLPETTYPWPSPTAPR